jgi:hypothetical protein
MINELSNRKWTMRDSIENVLVFVDTDDFECNAGLTDSIREEIFKN